MSKFVTFTDVDQYSREIFYAIDLEEIYMVEGCHRIYLKHDDHSIYIYKEEMIEKYVMPYINDNLNFPDNQTKDKS